MNRLVLMVLTVSISTVVGCTSTKSEAVGFSAIVEKIDSPGLIPLSETVHLADVEVAKELKRVNEEERSLAESDGPFKLEDYDKAIQQGYKGDRSFVSVMYPYRKPHGFLGHPAHFGVWVFRDNGEV